MIRIFQMTAQQVHQVAALEKRCFQDPWSENSVASELQNPLSLWLVAMDGDRVAGYVGSQTVLGESDMMNVAVDGAYRRQGVGKMLIEALMEYLKARESHCLTLEVRDSNTPARNLYGSLGFSEIGRRKNYYRNPKEDALILRKEWSL